MTFALIIVIGVITLGGILFKKYSYSNEVMSMGTYYNLTEEGQVAIVLQNEQIEKKAKLAEGVYYLDFDSVQKLLNDRFYEDTAEQLLLYTTPTEIIRTSIGENVYKINDEQKDAGYKISFYEEETLYVALDYVKLYTNFYYKTFTNPNRMQMKTQWGEITTAEIKRETAVRHRGGVKSDILRKVAKGETVTILEKLENWSKVKTSDAMIGYLENKYLINEQTFTEVPVKDYVEPEYTSLTRDYTINLGWHQVMAEGANGTLTEVVANTKGMNVISPTWFSLKDTNGGIRSIASADYVKKAHDMGLEVWALVDNFDKTVSTYSTLSRTTSRTNLINNLMKEVLAKDIDGINVDFEEVSYDAGEPFVQFIRELSIQCRKNGIVLSVDNYVPRESTAHYNRKEQGIVADYVIIMGYDEHWGSGGVAGSVASIGFVEDGIKQTVEEVPSHKVINALPFYTRVWQTNNGVVTCQTVGMEIAQNFISNNNLDMEWDEETCQNYGEIQKGNTFYQIWMEDKDSIETKLTVMKNYNLGGVAVWKLGFETPEIWNVIAAYVNS